MKKFGKTIKLFLIDGEPNGRMTCELSNWTGKAYKIPRIQIKESYNREDLQKPGVYLLFGKNEEGKSLVYIGEAEVIIDRLKQHVSQKEFWTEVVAFISKDGNLNKAHIKYLESRLYEIGSDLGRYIIENSSTPSRSSISEPDVAEMEEFLENIKILTNALGHKVFEELVSPVVDRSSKQDVFIIDAVRGAKGKGFPSSSGFIVLKGSEIAIKTVPSLTKSLSSMRQGLIDEKVISELNDKLVFMKDHEFSSPSTAAAIVMGRSANGLTSWKLKDGISLKEYEEN